MAKKATLNPLTDTPQSLVDITKDFMLAYMKMETISRQDKDWYKKLCHDNMKPTVNRFNGRETEAVDYKAVRQAFCEKYFPNLANRSPKKNRRYIDEVDAL